MSKEVSMHGPCPCGKSSDAYCVYDDHEWCYSCNKGKFDKMKEPEEYERMFGTGFRGVPEWVCELYGTETYGNGDEVLFRVYRDGTNGASKVRRTLDKDFRQRDGRMSGLFGSWAFNAGSSHYVTVVEGEEDALAAFTMLNTKADGKPTAVVQPVVAIPGAGIAKRDREDIYKYLSKFETVKLCIEDDEPGRAAKAELANMLPNKIREVPLTKYKDASEYLQNDDAREFKGAWDNAGLFTPDNVYNTREKIESLLNDEQDESYIPTGLDGLDDKIKGLCLNHVTLITAMEGMGKTELLRKFEYEVIKTGVPIAVLHFEETKAKNIRAIASYEAKENMRPKDVGKDKVLEHFRNLSNNFENFYLFEFKNEPSSDQFVDQVNYLVHVCGVKYIFIDPLNQLDPPDDKTSKVDFLDDICKKMVKYVANNPVGIVWTAHVDDEGRTRNSRMISKACSTRIDLKRDHLCEDEEERNTLHMMVSKNRVFAETGPAGVATFDPETFTILDVPVIETPTHDKKRIIPF